MTEGNPFEAAFLSGENRVTQIFKQSASFSCPILRSRGRKSLDLLGFLVQRLHRRDGFGQIDIVS